MFYSVSRGYVFVHVPRTGGYSIKRAIGEENRPVRSWHPSIDTIKTQLSDHQFRSFGFVRNPFERLFSWFKFSTRLPEPKDLADVRAKFQGFVQYHAERQLWPSAWHYLSIDGALAVDRIGRFEYLARDFADICQWLGLGDIELPHIHQTRTLDYPLADFYTADGRDLVLRHHAADFEHFGYADRI